MQAQNPLAKRLGKVESRLGRIMKAPFAFLFPSRIEPPEVLRELEHAMEDNLVLAGDGKRLAPIVYDIYVSIPDHQKFEQEFNVLRSDWQKRLINLAKQPQRHYTLKANPVLRLHADSQLRRGEIRVETSLGVDSTGEGGGVMSTQAISADQLAQLRAQLSPSGSFSSGQPQSSPQQGNMPFPPVVNPSGSFAGSAPSTAMPPAKLIIRLPQAGQQIYPIEKPIINIGRQLSNDIIVEDKRVSRYHAQIKYQANGQFAIYDLGSTNGITINGTPNQRQHTLRNGDRFTIGHYDFYFERS